MRSTKLANGAGSHTVKICRFVLRRMESGASRESVVDELETKGCSWLKAEALCLGSAVAYDALFTADHRRELVVAVAAEGITARTARRISQGAIDELDRVLAVAVPLALGRRRAHMVPRLQQRLGLSLQSARSFTRLVTRVVDRVQPALGLHDTFPLLEDLLDQLQAEGLPRLATARIVVGLYRHHHPSRVAG